MKEKVIHRIEKLIRHNDLSLNAFDKSIDAGNGYIGRQIKNEASIGSDVLEKIYSVYNVSGDWILGGTGPIERNYGYAQDTFVLKEPLDSYSSLNPFEKALLTSMKKKEFMDAIMEIVDLKYPQLRHTNKDK